MADEHKNQEAAAKSVDASQKEAAKDRDAQLASERKAADADTDAYYKRVSASKPTPTQEENDRAKLGFKSVEELDDKEDHGAPSEEDARVEAAKANLARAEAAKK